MRTKVIGAPLDPLSKETRHNIALVAFFAWVGLAALGILIWTGGSVSLLVVLYSVSLFLVGSSRGGGLHALLWVQRMLPDHFRNFICVNARTVDSHSYGGDEDMKMTQTEANVALTCFVNFCNSKGWAAKSYLAFGTDPVDDAIKLAERVHEQYPNRIYFASKLVFERENWLIRLLHNEAALAIQRRLHLQGLQMVILPMKI